MNTQSLNYREISDSAVMAKQPVVSVFMLAYKHERFIAQAIEGVVTQVCDFPFELIIAEDCSPDNSLSIALDYQRRYPHIIRVLTGDKNVGMNANAARGETTMRGKYAAGCEGDDFWHHPRKLQMQVDLMSANPDMVFCHTDFDRKTRFRTWHSKHKSHPSPWLAKDNAYVALLHHWSVMTATTMHRNDMLRAFKGTEFDRPDWPFGDYNLLLFSSLRGTVGYIDESTATFRKVRGSAGNRDPKANLRMVLAAKECAEMFMSRHPVPAETARIVSARFISAIYRAAYFSERLDLMRSNHEWLKENGFNPSEASHQARIFAVSSKLPIRAILAVKNFIDLRLSSIPA
ncbi:glycosyltransferase family 2 protein [Stenotrophobium rhamnosiphilum]|uniref:Glycosyltransferase 2-like domain-containing protein n=1 Tax=Stenotrophobium rhamnosiphilum TaxID=2029166 RepID=A0A2T5MDL3_9GAMM|nr:glycosyltransferase [Stenotrophobium rhamnosiphilum]PTU30671.1 hypothetical protein CJD38_14340 [Stenotrophobium rhamnosiphilum]